MFKLAARTYTREIVIAKGETVEGLIEDLNDELGGSGDSHEDEYGDEFKHNDVFNYLVYEDDNYIGELEFDVETRKWFK